MNKATRLLSLGLLLLAVGDTSAGTVSYSYDAAGRLTHAYYSDGSIEYVYDPSGNLLSRTVSAGISPSPIEPSMIAARTGSDLAIAYSTAACSAEDHAVFVGALGAFGEVSGAECSVGNSGGLTFPLPAGNVWFLIAGIEGDRYSSVGDDHNGERLMIGVEALCPNLTADTARSCP